MGNITWLAAVLTMFLAMTTCAISADVKTSPLPDLPESASSLGAITCDGWLYVYGGHTGKTHQYSTETASGRFHRLKLDGGQSWEELPSGPGLQGMNLATSGGKIYRVGGMQPRNKPSEPADSHSVADVACYDPATRRWEPMPPLPEPRSSHDVVALNNKLYVVGGWVMRGAQPTVWSQKAFVLDLVQPGAKWQTIEQPFQRRALTAAAVAGGSEFARPNVELRSESGVLVVDLRCPARRDVQRDVQSRRDQFRDDAVRQSDGGRPILAEPHRRADLPDIHAGAGAGGDSCGGICGVNGMVGRSKSTRTSAGGLTSARFWPKRVGRKPSRSRPVSRHRAM